MRFESFSFGSSSDRRRHGRDVVIDHGEVCKRKKRAYKKFRDSFGHKPVSMQEEIPWKCQRLVIGTGMGVFPVMMEVKGDAERHGIAYWWSIEAWRREYSERRSNRGNGHRNCQKLALKLVQKNTDCHMKWADVRFYSELNDFLTLCRRSRTTSYAFDVSGSVKDMIEALGVPHTEVDLVLANGQSVDFSYRVQNGDRISVYPGFEAIDISPLVWLRPQPLRVLRFVADTHLGRLTAYLRMVGFDTLYRSDYPDEELAKISSNEKRILLTGTADC